MQGIMVAVYPKTVTHSTKTAAVAVVISTRAVKTKTVMVDGHAKQDYGLIHVIKYQLISTPIANDMNIV